MYRCIEEIRISWKTSVVCVENVFDNYVIISKYYNVMCQVGLNHEWWILNILKLKSEMLEVWFCGISWSYWFLTNMSMLICLHFEWPSSPEVCVQCPSLCERWLLDALSCSTCAPLCISFLFPPALVSVEPVFVVIHLLRRVSGQRPIFHPPLVFYWASLSLYYSFCLHRPFLSLFSHSISPVAIV